MIHCILSILEVNFTCSEILYLALDTIKYLMFGLKWLIKMYYEFLIYCVNNIKLNERDLKLWYFPFRVASSFSRLVYLKLYLLIFMYNFHLVITYSVLPISILVSLICVINFIVHCTYSNKLIYLYILFQVMLK